MADAAYKVGIRRSPHGINGGMTAYEGIDDQYLTLTKALVATGVQYVHVVDDSAMGAPPVPVALTRAMRQAWPRTFILAGGDNKASATVVVVEGEADLIAFGRPVLANPGFVARLTADLPQNAVDFSTPSSPGEKGSTDSPTACLRCRSDARHIGA